MRTMILAILVATGALLTSLFLPWWGLVLPALLFGAWLGKKGWSSFLAGFGGVGMLWLLQTSRIHYLNDGILTARVAEMLALPEPLLLILLSALAGALAGGFSTLTGYLFRKAFFPAGKAA